MKGTNTGGFTMKSTNTVLARFADIGEVECPMDILDIICGDPHIEWVIDAETGELIFDKHAHWIGNGFEQLKPYLDRC
mgnify:CR=1 FL=1